MANYRAIGGGNIAIRYKEIAVAAANQTFTQQLTQLKTTWDTLTDDEKMRCVVLQGSNTIYRSYFINSGTFCSLYCGASKFYSYNLDIPNCKRYSWNSIDALTPVDASSNTNSDTLSLMLLCNY